MMQDLIFSLHIYLYLGARTSYKWTLLYTHNSRDHVRGVFLTQPLPRLVIISTLNGITCLNKLARSYRYQSVLTSKLTEESVTVTYYWCLIIIYTLLPAVDDCSRSKLPMTRQKWYGRKSETRPPSRGEELLKASDRLLYYILFLHQSCKAL